MMFSLKLCAKKRFQPFIKLLLIIAVIGIYFIVLLRESLAAWESTKVKTTNLNSANDVSIARYNFFLLIYCCKEVFSYIFAIYLMFF